MNRPLPMPMTKARLKTIDLIIEIIGESHTIAVCSHMRPDGDCIGSTLGLALALLDQGREVTCWNQDPVPSKLRFLDPDQLIPVSYTHLTLPTSDLV